MGRPITQSIESLLGNRDLITAVQNSFPKFWVACSRHAWNNLEPALDTVESEILATRCVPSSSVSSSRGPTGRAGCCDTGGGIVDTVRVCFSWHFSARLSFLESEVCKPRMAWRVENAQLNHPAFWRRMSESRRSSSWTDINLLRAKISLRYRERTLDWYRSTFEKLNHFAGMMDYGSTCRAGRTRNKSNWSWFHVELLPISGFGLSLDSYHQRRNTGSRGSGERVPSGSNSTFRRWGSECGLVWLWRMQGVMVVFALMPVVVVMSRSIAACRLYCTTTAGGNGYCWDFRWMQWG